MKMEIEFEPEAVEAIIANYIRTELEGTHRDFPFMKSKYKTNFTMVLEMFPEGAEVKYDVNNTVTGS